MKRIICMLLMLVLLVPAVHADGEFTFTLSGAEGKVGDTVTLTGAVENAPTCASYRVIMTYDTAVLKPVEGKNAGSKGLFIINVNAKYQEKPAVNALSADAAKVLEGTQDLFTATFEIIGTPAEGTEPIQVAYQEFFAADLSRQTPVIKVGGVQVTTDPAPAPETPEETPVPPAEDTPAEESPVAETPEEDAPTTDAPAEESPEEPALPDGNWAVDEKNEEVIFVPESGDAITYVPDFPETIEPGEPTDILLKDENGNDAGSITVEKQEDGTIKVILQNAKLPTAAKKTVPGWVWGLIGVGAIVAIGAVALIIYAKKEKKDHE